MTKKPEIKRCAKCVLPETYPGITFNQQGICHYCLAHKKMDYLGGQALEQILASYRHKGGQYDCLVPVSGGRDSAFALHQLQKVYNLRVLAYNYDSGFLSTQAQDNLRQITAALNVELIVVKSKRDIQCRNLRPLIRVNLRQSPKHVLYYLCSGCRHGYLGGAYKIAIERDIPLIVLGDSQMESAAYKKIAFADCEPTIKEKIKYALKTPLNFLKRKRYNYLLEKEFPLHKYEGAVKVLHFYDYIEWDEDRILTTIRNELNWRTPQGRASSWRFDCKMHALVNYLTRALFGFTEKEDLYSKMIREGKLTREEASRRLAEEKRGEEAELRVIEEVFDRLALSRQEREAILSGKNLPRQDRH